MVTSRFRTLIEMLEERAAQTPDRVAFTFQSHPQTYGELWAQINRFGRHLQRLNLEQGDRVVLALPNGPEFFAAFYGCHRAGGIPVPLFPGSGAERIFSIAGLCGSKIVVGPSNTPEDQRSALKKAGAERGLQVLIFSESAGAEPTGAFPDPVPQDLAMIQYTSGSTGNPKGVQLSHQNLLTNVEQMVRGMEITEDEIFVSWLPVYHDLGLILMTMAPFYMGAELHLLPTDLKDVRPWLRAVETYRATYTAAPDFAYRLCLRYVEPEDYDLRSLRVALNAAEPVRAQTLNEFEAAFRLKDVMAPGYGLAEATVGVSMCTPGTPVRVDARGFVSVGPPFPGVELMITHEEKPVPPGQIGDIAIRSPANTRGYYNNPEATHRLMRWDGYLRSGDLGYLDEDGYLYITGRKKNIIQIAGETIWPREVEEQADNHPAVRYSAAIGVDRGRIEGEQLYVFAEIRNGEQKLESELHRVALELVDSVYDHLGYRPGRVYLLKPRSIPKTFNGKIQHARLKTQYLYGSLHAAAAILYPEF